MSLFFFTALEVIPGHPSLPLLCNHCFWPPDHHDPPWSEALIQVLLHHGLFASNTAFEHVSRHKRSWIAWIKDKNAPVHSTVTKSVYNFFARPALNPCLLMLVLTLSSDHKPVVACQQFAYIPLVWGQGSIKSKALYDLCGLTSDYSQQEVYCEDLHDHVSRIQPSTDPNKALVDMLDCVKSQLRQILAEFLPTRQHITSRPSCSWLIATRTTAITHWDMQWCQPSKRTTQPTHAYWDSSTMTCKRKKTQICVKFQIQLIN